VLLDLSESLICPRCGPPQGLIVLVEKMDGRRISSGRLDCPACEARFPLQAGVLDFREPSARVPSPEEGPAAGSVDTLPGATRTNDSTIIAALFGIREGRGLLVVGPGLGESAPGIAELSGGCEVLRLEGRLAETDPSVAARVPGGTDAGPVTLLRGIPGDAVPLLAARAVGVALATGEVREIDEAARILSPGGRLVILRPESPTTVLAGDPRFELIARDERAVVARRT
jgi:hypothetical protein